MYKIVISGIKKCIINRMNASDIIKSKQNATLYNSYYNPSIYSSTTYTTSYPILSTINNIPTPIYSTCTNTINVYTSNPYTSYELASNVNNGMYICGNKKVSQMEWQANTSIQTQPVYACSSFVSSLSTFISCSQISSINSHSNRPLICGDSYIQGNFTNTCNMCNNIGAGINACCYKCVSGS